MLAGFGRAVITPEVPVFLAGFSDRTVPAERVDADLEVRVLHLSDGEQSGCLVLCDLLGMTAHFSDPIRDRVGADAGLPRDRVLTACTHTHSGPSAIAGGERLGWPTPDGYLERLVEACATAAAAARDAAEPAEVAFARAPLPDGLSINRRGLPYDPTFAVLDVRRPDGGDRIGVLANIAIHPVALGSHCLAVSPDWVGTFRTELERLAGGTALLLQGALGDVNPREPHHHDEGGDFEEAASLGVAVAAAVASVLGDTEPLTASLATAGHRVVTVPTGPTPLTMLLGHDGELVCELVEWAIGAARLVTVPGEAFHELGRDIEASRAGPVLLAGLSPVWQGYLPRPFGDGYEETVSYGEPAVEALHAHLTTDPLPE
jgi:neutral ceramidase